MAVPGEAAEEEEEEEATGWELAMKAFLPILFVACNISLADKSNWQRSPLSLSIHLYLVSSYKPIGGIWKFA